MTIVQTTSATGTTTATAVHFGGSPVVGNAIIVGISINSSSPQRVVSVTDGAQNTYTYVGSAAGTGLEVEMWIAQNIASAGGAHTVTVTAQSGDAIMLLAAEISGLSKYKALDKVTPGNFGNSTAMDAGSLTTTNGIEFVIGVFGETAVRPFSLTNGYATNSFTSGSTGLALASQTFQAIGTYTPSTSIDVANNWAGIGAAFSDSPAGKSVYISKSSRPRPFAPGLAR